MTILLVTTLFVALSTTTISINVSNLIITQISSNFVINNKVTMHNNYAKIKFIINKFSSL